MSQTMPETLPTDPNGGLRRVGLFALLLAGASGLAALAWPGDNGVFLAGMLALVTFAVPACVVGHQLGYVAWRERRRRARMAKRPIRMRLVLHG